MSQGWLIIIPSFRQEVIKMEKVIVFMICKHYISFRDSFNRTGSNPTFNRDSYDVIQELKKSLGIDDTWIIDII